ncbi:uncharacterized protein LOC117170159 [Belonocnema kinseyi]|uniref:uncharacterized protein LOC117170159 n=1 Tax=Belonocnema kinseyi TaxID=2817044 RepID=UPI00143DF9FD|nr:uncharacterized protein LOC117170159 [Belonocnema kinseyi]
MKISNCILILTFAVYLDCVECREEGPRPPPPPVEWISVSIDGYPVLFTRDPWSGRVTDIHLLTGNQARATSRDVGIRRITNDLHSMDFVVFFNRHTGVWTALAPITPEIEELLEEEAEHHG